MIKIKHGLITGRAGNRSVIRGEIDQQSLSQLQIDWYQRGKVKPYKIQRLQKAMEGGSDFPDIVVGIRGSDDSIIAANQPNEISIQAPCYIVDGLQRWTAAMLCQDNNIRVALGIKGYTNSDVTFEREMFRKMNTAHTAMGASVILRNEKEDSTVAATLFGLSVNEPRFALNGHVAWEQEANKVSGGDYLRGTTLLRVLGVLHAHLIPGVRSAGTSQILTLLETCDRRIQKEQLVKLNTVRNNLITFFDVIDEVWGIRSPPIKFGVIYMLDGWMLQIARIFSDHREFWRENDLFVSASWIRDLRKIEPHDHDLINLARGNHVQRELLHQTMLGFLNKNKTSNRLRNRYDEDKDEVAAERARYSSPHHTGDNPAQP